MYLEFRPSELLAPYIDKYWVFKESPVYDSCFKILPDGYSDFIFSIGHATKLAGENRQAMQPFRCYYVGPMTTYSEVVACADSLHMLGVRFLPAGLAAFTRLPLHELSDQRISAEDIHVLFNDAFTEMLCEKKDIRSRIEAIEEHLITNLTHCYPVDKRVLYAITLIEREGGRMPVGMLMDKVCICQRHLERKFKEYTGYTAKEYSRIVKFQNTLHRLKHQHVDNFSDLIMEAGYYDLSHFFKESRRLAGVTPDNLLALSVPGPISLTYLE